LISFISFLNQTNETNQRNQTNQTNEINQIPAARRERVLTHCHFRHSSETAACFDGKNPHTPRNFHLPRPAQAGDCQIELVPGEFRVASHQGFELTFRGASEEFEDSVGNGLLL
jgi:hypothetical protein